MSDLPGGPAGKAGANYEALWGVRAMLGLLNGHAERMRIEELASMEPNFTSNGPTVASIGKRSASF